MFSQIVRNGQGQKALAPAIVFLCCMSGCVHRQMIITSEPSGAVVQVNGKTIGVTPVDVPFTHYGAYQISLQKDGYEKEIIHQPIPAPWYQWPGVDFISEHLVPVTIRDVHPFVYPLRPKQIVPPEVVLERSRNFRQRGQAIGAPQSGIVPILGPPIPTGVSPAPGISASPTINPNN